MLVEVAVVVVVVVVVVVAAAAAAAGVVVVVVVAVVVVVVVVVVGVAWVDLGGFSEGVLQWISEEEGSQKGFLEGGSEKWASRRDSEGRDTLLSRVPPLDVRPKLCRQF